jgi:hypothetical protein
LAGVTSFQLLGFSSKLLRQDSRMAVVLIAEFELRAKG